MKKLVIVFCVSILGLQGTFAQDLSVERVWPEEYSYVKNSGLSQVKVYMKVEEGFEPESTYKFSWSVGDRQLSELGSGRSMDGWVEGKSYYLNLSTVYKGDVGDTVVLNVAVSAEGDKNQSNDTMSFKFLAGDSDTRDLKVSVLNSEPFDKDLETWSEMRFKLKANNIGLVDFSENDLLQLSLLADDVVVKTTTPFSYKGGQIRSYDTVSIDTTFIVGGEIPVGKSELCVRLTWVEVENDKAKSVELNNDNNSECFDVNNVLGSVNGPIRHAFSASYAQNRITVKLDRAENEGSYNMNVYNMSGQLFQSEIVKATTGVTVVDASSLSKGLYLVKLSSQNELFGTAKVMVR